MAQVNFMDNFTKLYSLSKTLRFELKPIGKTEEFMTKNQILLKDQIIENSYQKAKPYLDKLHRQFVKEALSNQNLINLDLDRFKNYWLKFQESEKNKNDKKEYDIACRSFYREIGKTFNVIANNWMKKYSGQDYFGLRGKVKKIKFKSEGYKILTDEAILGILQKSFPDQKDIFTIFDGFFTYFSKFNETRENFYKDDGTSTAIATRILENLTIFLENQEVYLKQYRPILDKLKLSKDEIQIFKTIFYKFCLLQDGINTYNNFLGGEKDTDISINQKVNEYRQKTGKKIPFLKKLNRQILGEIDQQDDYIKLEGDVAEKDLLLKYLPQLNDYSSGLNKKAGDLMAKLFDEKNEFDLSQIYFGKMAINTISSKYFADRSIFKKHIKIEDNFISLLSVFNILDSEDLKNISQKEFWKEEYQKFENFSLNKTISENFKNIFYSEFKKTLINQKNSFINIQKANLLKLERLDSNRVQENDKGSQQIALIKIYMDAVLSTFQMMKYFSLEKAGKKIEIKTGTDNNFYNFFDEYYQDNKLIFYYNSFRNFLTKKPFSEDKIKLNFEKGNLLSGWAESPKGSAQYCSYIFRKSHKYYLGITDYATILDQEKFSNVKTSQRDDYEQMVYKQLKSQTIYGSIYKSLFKTEYAKDKNVLANEEIIGNIKQILQKQINDFSHLRKYINKEYKDAKELARDLSEENLYSLNFVPVNGRYIEKIEHDIKGSNKYLYLFEILNKDFRHEIKNVAKNLHTLYFENLFSEDNLKSPILKLSGGAEIFYRKATKNLPKKRNKNDVIVKNKKGEEIFEHRRYSQNKLFFHLPVVINMSLGNPKQFNQLVNEKIYQNSGSINVVGVDRGEKNLAYYSVIDKNQKIIEQGSFNEVNGINYWKLLEEREKNRNRSQQSWRQQLQIKDLKKGFVSHAVKKICDLIIKYNAIVVFEDLNVGFKRRRQKIEKNSYQQIEKALIEKLNYLVFKDKELKDNGGVLNGFQLTDQFNTFQKMGKQTGIIFYTQASYTSKIDPMTGWRPNLYFSYANADKAKEDILSSFTKITLSSIKGRFEFTYKIQNQGSNKKKTEVLNKTEWTLCSCVERYHWNKQLRNNKGDYQFYANLTDNWIKLFKDFSLDLNQENLLVQIKNMKTKNNENFFKGFIFLWGLLCQIRNTDKDKSGNENDFILSPVEPFFDSRKDFQDKKFDGDANGAYNIARKGLIILDRIRDVFPKKEKAEWSDLAISSISWDNFAQK